MYSYHINMSLHIQELQCAILYGLFPIGGNSKHSLILLFTKDINRGVRKSIMAVA